ncbi:MAG: hypothetical protein ABIQ53_06825 [Terracoccus sp.]
MKPWVRRFEAGRALAHGGGDVVVLGDTRDERLPERRATAYRLCTTGA